MGKVLPKCLRCNDSVGVVSDDAYMQMALEPCTCKAGDVFRQRQEVAMLRHVWPKPRPISEAPTDGSYVLGHWSTVGYPRLRGCRWAVVKMGSGLAWFNENNEPLSDPDYFLPLPPEVP